MQNIGEDLGGKRFSIDECLLLEGGVRTSAKTDEGT